MRYIHTYVRLHSFITFVVSVVSSNTPWSVSFSILYHIYSPISRCLLFFPIMYEVEYLTASLGDISR